MNTTACYYRTISLETDGIGLIFKSDRVILEFGSDANLTTVTVDGNRFEMKSPELFFTTGGYYKSSIDLINKNKNWASLKPHEMVLLAPESKYLSHSIVRTHNAVELHLNVMTGSFRVEKVYTLISGRAEFSRRFTVTNMGSEVMLRNVRLAFPSIGDFRPCGFPYPQKFAENGSKTLTAWFDPRGEVINIDHSFNCTVSIENRLSAGDSVSSGEVFYTLVNGDRYEAAEFVRDRLETVGLRAHHKNEHELQRLVVYEVEIGPLRLSETKCHHRYDHPSELAEDLPRIKALGFNTIELMPSFLFPCYTVFDLKNPDIQHGAGESIRPIIERAHELGMKVILDILMHGCIDLDIAEWDEERYISRRYYWPEWKKRIPQFCSERISPLRAKHPDWFIYEKPGEIFRGYTWTFDHANAGFQEYFCEAMEITVRDWKIDGFRFDAPNWQSGVNSAENLPYSGADSVNFGHCELLRAVRNRLEKKWRNLIYIVESPYYQYSDSCDMSYSYDLYHIMKNVREGRETARYLQEFALFRDKIYPKGSLWLNFTDNHDTWNNGVNEDGLYSYDRFGTDFAKAVFALSCFQKGGLQAFGGFEDGESNFSEFAGKVLKLRAELSELIGESDVDYSLFPSDKRVICVARQHQHSGEKLYFLANLSIDELTCEVPDLGIITFKPCGVKLFKNSKELII
jgi:hypothetical protein